MAAQDLIFSKRLPTVQTRWQRVSQTLDAMPARLPGAVNSKEMRCQRTMKEYQREVIFRFVHIT